MVRQHGGNANWRECELYRAGARMKNSLWGERELQRNANCISFFRCWHASMMKNSNCRERKLENCVYAGMMTNSNCRGTRMVSRAGAGTEKLEVEGIGGNPNCIPRRSWRNSIMNSNCRGPQILFRASGGVA